MLKPRDTSAVVCTLNSISSIEECLRSLRDVGVEEIIVVDGGSTDGTRETAEKLADITLADEGKGLGAARNLGIAHTTKALILNMGSDNVMPPNQLQVMIDTLEDGELDGVSAQTRVQGENYASRGLNAWREGKFPTGPARVIGTPTLFRGERLRAHPYDAHRRFSDDSELCERWSREFGAQFAIAPAYVYELGKTSWHEVWVRCQMYGESDHEVMSEGARSDWSLTRKAKALLHPLRTDAIRPLTSMRIQDGLRYAPFLVTFAGMRYAGWAKTAMRRH